MLISAAKVTMPKQTSEQNLLSGFAEKSLYKKINFYPWYFLGRSCPKLPTWSVGMQRPYLCERSLIGPGPGQSGANKGRRYLLVPEFKLHCINTNWRMFQGCNIQSTFLYFMEMCPSWGNPKRVQRMHDLSVTSKCSLNGIFPHTKGRWLTTFHLFLL